MPTVAIHHGSDPAVSWMMMGKAVSTAEYGSVIYDAWAAFIATQLTGTLKDTAGNTHNLDLKWEEAAFTFHQNFNNTINTVSLNSTPLWKYWFLNAYLASDSTGIWDGNAGNNWQFTDGNNAIVMSANATGPFPVFTGIFPDSISRQANFSYTFNASGCSNADSAYVVLISDDYKLQSSVVSGASGTAVIAAQRMVNMSNLFFSIKPYTYWGAVLKIVLYNHTFQTINGKRYTFVNQKEVLGKVILY